MDNNLLHIFLEAAHYASVIPLASEATIYAVKAFNQGLNYTHVVAAIAGGLLGHMFNLLLGRLVMRLPSSPKHHEFFRKLSHYLNRYGFVLLVLAPATLGNFLVFLAGMLGTPYKKALPMIAIGLGYYYGRLLF